MFVRVEGAADAATTCEAQADAISEVPAIPSFGGRVAPDLAGSPSGPRPDVVLSRPARREPSADRPNGRRPQARAVHDLGGDRVQGDRGRVPVRLTARLRV